MFARYLLLSSGLLLGFMITMARFTAVSSEKVYGYGFIALGLTSFISAPMIFLELGSPLYTISAAGLGALAVLFGVTEIVSGPLASPASIARVGAITSLVYFAGVYVPSVRSFLIDKVSQHTVEFLSPWYHIEITPESYDHASALAFTGLDPTFITYIGVACTGIGAFALVCGIVSVFDVSTMRKLFYVTIFGTIIYGLNLLRNVFVAVAFVEQWFDIALLYPMAYLMGADHQEMVSFVMAESVITQLFSAVILIFGLYLLVTYTTLLDTWFRQIEVDIKRVRTTVRSRLGGSDLRSDRSERAQ